MKKFNTKIFKTDPEADKNVQNQQKKPAISFLQKLQKQSASQNMSVNSQLIKLKKTFGCQTSTNLTTETSITGDLTASTCKKGVIVLNSHFTKSSICDDFSGSQMQLASTCGSSDAQQSSRNSPYKLPILSMNKHQSLPTSCKTLGKAKFSKDLRRPIKLLAAIRSNSSLVPWSDCKQKVDHLQDFTKAVHRFQNLAETLSEEE